MRAITISRLDGPGSYAVTELPRPSRGAGEVLVEVHSVAPAFPDLLLSRGEYQVKPDLPFSPGSDFAGVVVDADAESGFKQGQRVAGCLMYGAAAELVSVHADRLFGLPDSLETAEAAALPMNYFTAYFALAQRGAAESGDWVLITGASGGVGVAAIQVAKGLGCKVIALVSNERRRAVAEEAGADFVILPQQMPTEVKSLTNGAGIDIAVDVVGGDVTNLLRVLAPLGRIMIVGFASGEIPVVKVNRLLLNNTDVRGVDSARLIFDRQSSRAAWEHLMRMRADGHIRPQIIPGGDAARYGTVLQELSDRAVSGRVVLSMRATAA
ncbi:NADPH:quinone oxidoreductase family protein [Leucobacter japonicus]|uniref:NADPH:quinone oxidoreductase family protein n=1 Tax=Leucobacter japonicus TaxID=1461259 RepID=UPI0006A75AF5|nr:NADPH:quinone oxidoreductase family protein [Leucobacter japonicus]